MDSNDGDRTLTMKDVQIYNSSNVGLLARTGDVYGENMIINNSGQTSLSCSLGGRYTFNHSTFANYWRSSFRLFPAVSIDNVIQINETETRAVDLIEANFNNCIIFGNEQRELSLIEDSSAAFNFNFSNCLIRFEDPNGDFDDVPNYDFSNQNLYTNIVKNSDPVFLNTDINDMNIETENSAANGIGNTATANLVPVDANGTVRSLSAPDAGAFESIIFPDPEE